MGENGWAVSAGAGADSDSDARWPVESWDGRAAAFVHLQAVSVDPVSTLTLYFNNRKRQHDMNQQRSTSLCWNYPMSKIDLSYVKTK